MLHIIKTWHTESENANSSQLTEFDIKNVIYVLRVLLHAKAC